MAYESLGPSHFNDQGWELQRTNNFEIFITDLDENKRKIITLSVASGFLPDEGNDPIDISYGNTKVSVAGVFSGATDGSIVVRDVIQQDVEKIIEDWRSKVYNKETGAVGMASEYKKPARIVQYAPDGTHARTWKLEGVWPSRVNYGTLDYESNNIKTIDITLRYDLAKIDPDGRP